VRAGGQKDGLGVGLERRAGAEGLSETTAALRSEGQEERNHDCVSRTFLDSLRSLITNKPSTRRFAPRPCPPPRPSVRSYIRNRCPPDPPPWLHRPLPLDLPPRPNLCTNSKAGLHQLQVSDKVRILRTHHNTGSLHVLRGRGALPRRRAHRALGHGWHIFCNRHPGPPPSFQPLGTIQTPPD